MATVLYPRCPNCHRPLKPLDVEPAEGGGFRHRTPRTTHRIPIELARAVLEERGQNSGRSAAPRSAARRPRRSKTRRSSRKGIGGRPLAFIPALVVAEAARLAGLGVRWASILEGLERGGNGRYARNTLIRRVAKYSAVQNSAVDAGGRGRRRAARARSKTDPGNEQWSAVREFVERGARAQAAVDRLLEDE